MEGRQTPFHQESIGRRRTYGARQMVRICALLSLHCFDTDGWVMLRHVAHKNCIAVCLIAVFSNPRVSAL